MKKIRIITIIIFCLGLGSFYGLDYYNEHYIDHTPPVITADEKDITISTKDSLAAILTGLTVTDDVDGDITDSLVVERLSNFLKDGSREAVVFASDSAGNVTKVTRKVYYSNYKKPKLKIKAPLMVPLGSSYTIKDLIHIKDSLDGSLDQNMQLSTKPAITDVNPDTYTLNIYAANSAGDVVSYDVTLECYDPVEYASSAHIELTKYIVYKKKGEEINPKDYLKKITAYNTEFVWKKNKNKFVKKETETYYNRFQDVTSIRYSDLKIKSNVDTSEPGCYEITYRIKNLTEFDGVVRLIVIVRE